MPKQFRSQSPHGDPVGLHGRLDRWLRLRRTYVVGTIATIALVLRVFCFLQLAASPFLWLHESDQNDMHTFHNWARTIAEGDWWSKTIGPPLHNWHRQIAADYAELFPAEWAKLETAAASGDPDGAARALWERWCGGGRTYQGPLYPYLIAGIYWLCGPAVGLVFAGQMALGVVSIVLVHLISRRLFDDVAALAAAVFMLLYGPLVFYEFVLLRASLIVFAGLLLVLMLDRAAERESAGSWLGVGLVLGLAIALKAHFVLMLFAAAGLLIFDYRNRWRRLARPATGFVAGLLVSYTPIVVRNVVSGAPALATAGNGPITLLVSNVRGTGTAGWDARHAARILAETEGAFFPTLIATLKTHPNVSSYLHLFLGKLKTTCEWYEVPNNVNFYYARLHSAVLRALPVSFVLIAPPAVVGLALTVRRVRRCAPLYALIAASLAVLLFFFSFARFRLPLAAAMTPLAGFALSRAWQLLSVRRRKAAAATLVAAVLPAILLSPIGEEQATVRTADVLVGHELYYDVLVRAAWAQGDRNAAAEVLRESLRRMPRDIRKIGAARPARTVSQAEQAAFCAEVQERLAFVLRESGKEDEAQAAHRRAEELRKASEHLLSKRVQPAESPAAAKSTTE